MRFSGNVAIVTGGGSGIGEAIARRLAAEGAHVMIAGRDEAKLAAAASAMGSRNQIGWCQGDVAKEPDVANMITRTIEKFGKLDLVVNNAGCGGYTPVVGGCVDTWMEVFAVDLHSAFFVCRAAIPHMQASGGGAILNIASTSGLCADPGFGAYNAAKAGLINLSRTIALEHVSDNIRSNCISPGFVRTPSSEAVPQDMREDWFGRIPMTRWGEPDEIAGAAAFLLSREASYITGENLVIDGGMRACSHQPSFASLFATSD